MADPADDARQSDAYTTAKPSKFHFKSSSSRRKRRHDRDDEHSRSHRSHRSSTRDRSASPTSPRRHHRSSRRKQAHRTQSDRHPTSTLDGEYYDPTHRHRESLYDNLDDHPTAAAADDTFRESLFDALADDEGAAYWEGVYGQPINIYPSSRPGPDGELERMTEDEYATFVRAKMWEKSHQHIVEEREKRERARKERKNARAARDEEVGREEREREDMRRRMEESLRRGEERKRVREAERSWEVYVKKWAVLNNDDGVEVDGVQTKDPRSLIPWPVLSGAPQDINKPAIERFLRAFPAWSEDAAALLKAERLRWHPDKMQRRFGQRIDKDIIRDVTAVFQVIDQLWSARR